MKNRVRNLCCVIISQSLGPRPRVVGFIFGVDTVSLCYTEAMLVRDINKHYSLVPENLPGRFNVGVKILL